MMESLQWFIDLFLHLDDHLQALIEQFGVWTYVILFAVVFVETGLVIMPLLPGDSLLFAAGAFAALMPQTLNPATLIVVLSIAAILGDTVNYAIGRAIGPKAFSGRYRFFKQEHLLATQAFYEKYGSRMIILARFVPIVRTFAPFVAGIGSMNYRRFIIYNIVGGIGWVTIFVLLGYFFGNVPFVKKNFEIVMVAIVVVSVVPMIYEYLMSHRGKSRQPMES